MSYYEKNILENMEKIRIILTYFDRDYLEYSTQKYLYDQDLAIFNFYLKRMAHKIYFIEKNVAREKHMREEKYFRIPIQELILCQRIENILVQHKIYTVGELITQINSEKFNISGISKGSLKEIYKRLQVFNEKVLLLKGEK